jgi:hypothetical protein
MKTLIVVIIFSALIALYAIWGRDWLKTKPWAAGFFAWVEPIEIALFKKSETILFARLKIVTGALLAFLSSIGAIDLTPIMPFVPDKYAPWVHASVNLLPLLISALGALDEYLRNRTTKPLELVAVPEKTIAENPKIAEAITVAAEAKAEAVAVVAEQKAA